MLYLVMITDPTRVFYTPISFSDSIADDLFKISALNKFLTKFWYFSLPYRFFYKIAKLSILNNINQLSI